MDTDPVAVLHSMVADGTLRGFEPAIADLDMHRPKGFHHKDNLEHSIRVLGNAIDRETNGPDLVLRAAALLHDIGKPATRKLGSRKSVTFDGHEAVGAKIVRRLLPRHGYSKAEIRQVEKLVALHMRSHGFRDAGWTDSAVRRLITDVNDDALMDRLVIIFYADVTTRHDHKRRAIHASVDGLVQEMARIKKEDARKALRPALTGYDIMELTGLSQGPELGRLMKFLNSDEGIHLSRDEAIAAVQTRL